MLHVNITIKTSNFEYILLQDATINITKTTYLLALLMNNTYYDTRRNSHPKVFCKEGVLKNFTKFTGKHLCSSLVFNKVA